MSAAAAAATAAFAVSGSLDCPLLTAAARNNLLIAVVAVAIRGFLLLARWVDSYSHNRSG